MSQEETAALPDDDWATDVFETTAEWLKFHRDWLKLPPELRD